MENETTQYNEEPEDPIPACPVCGAEVELTGTIYACTECNWWQYSSS